MRRRTRAAPPRRDGIDSVERARVLLNRRRGRGLDAGRRISSLDPAPLYPTEPYLAQHLGLRRHACPNQRGPHLAAERARSEQIVGCLLRARPVPAVPERRGRETAQLLAARVRRELRERAAQVVAPVTAC